MTVNKGLVLLERGRTLPTLRRLLRGNELMGCKGFERRRQKALETRSWLRDEKIARLTKGCDQGDANACWVLRSRLGTEAYDRKNKFRSGIHRNQRPKRLTS